jgi:light-regulated signal transduction histidine kinase (bacteriophytochrome)
MTEELCRLREEELALFAKIGADISHEMRNVLSIVNENAGLLDDQLALARGRKVPDLDKLKKVAARTARQVSKGIEVMERFSRFAHAADEQEASVDLVTVVGDVTVLAQRHFRHLGGSLEVAFPDQPVPITTNPFSLQYTLFRCVQIVWECAEKNEPVRVTLSHQGTAAVLTVSGAAIPGSDEISHRRSELTVVLNELEASVETSCADGVLLLVLTLPVRSVRADDSQPTR